MSPRRSASRALAWLAAVVVATGGAALGCEPLGCPEEETLLVEDGSYHEAPSSDPPPRPLLRDVTAEVQDGELTVRYVQDTDGRTYGVRLRERE